jgi:hypothetical protein
MLVKCCISLLIKAMVLLLVGEAAVQTGKSQPPQESESPKVVTAVAPVFIPFVLGKTGTEKVVIEVRINPLGDVTSAKTVKFSLFGDQSIEDAAKLWQFAAAANNQERTVLLTFVFRIMPKGTAESELTTIFTAPYQVEVRHEVFEPLKYVEAPTASPSKPRRPQNKKKP